MPHTVEILHAKRRYSALYTYGLSYKLSTMSISLRWQQIWWHSRLFFCQVYLILVIWFDSGDSKKKKKRPETVLAVLVGLHAKVEGDVKRFILVAWLKNSVYFIFSFNLTIWIRQKHKSSTKIHSVRYKATFFGFDYSVSLCLLKIRLKNIS